MPINKINTAIMHLAVISNFVLIGIILVKLSVAPADVREEVLEVHKQVVYNTGLIQKEIGEFSDRLDGINAWINETNTLLKERTRDRLYKEQLKQWIQQTRETNPDLNLPPLIEDPEGED